MKTKTIVLCSLMTLTALAAYILVIADPIREYVSTDGALHIRGSVSGAFLDYLQHGPRPQLEIHHLVVVDHPGGTMSWTEQVLDVRSSGPSPEYRVRAYAPTLKDIVAPVIDALKLPIILLFDLLTGNAAAANRFLVLGGAGCVSTTIATDLDCWSTVSGGAGGASIPGAADVAFADGSSGAGTGTQDAAMSVLGLNTTGFTGTWATGNFALTIGTTGFTLAGGTFNAGSSTITVSGTTNMTGGTFNEGTSTLSASGTWTLTMDVAGSASVNTLYNLTLTSGSITTATIIGMANILNVAAGTTLNNGCDNIIYLNGADANALTVGASSAIIWAPLVWNTSVAANIPNATYAGGTFGVGAGNPTIELRSAQTFTATGALTLNDCSASNQVGDLTLTAGTFVKGTQTLIMGQLRMTGGDMTSTSGAVTINGFLNISSAASAIDFGSETWTITGAWTNASTDGTVWDAGTGIVVLNSASALILTFAGTNLAEDEFATVDMASTAGPATTYTMATRGLRLNFLNIYSDTVLSTSGANLSITTGRLDVAAGSTITLNASTLTVSGDINMTGTYSGTSATLVLSGTSTQTLSLAGSNVNALSITGGGTKAFTSAFVTSSVSVSVAVTFQITAVVTWTHNGTTLIGAAGGFLTLRSGTSGSAWNLSRGGASLTATRVDVADSSASAIVDACDPSNIDSGGNSNWDFCVEPTRPPGPRTLHLDVICNYNPFILTWFCVDRTDYSGWLPQVFETLRYNYDGIEVAATTDRGGSISFRETGETWIDDGRAHLLIVTWTLSNGGTPSASYVLVTSHRLAQIVLALLGVFLLSLLIVAFMRRRGGATAYERVQNPSYRRTAIAVEEYPKGWRSYRQRPYRSDLPTRSERHGNRWIIYQLRPATADEQARTGRKRIAYVQTVREKI